MRNALIFREAVDVLVVEVVGGYYTIVLIPWQCVLVRRPMESVIPRWLALMTREWR